MRCEEAQELITARVDNELDGAERAAIDEHLKSCADCATAYERENLLKRRVQVLARQVSAPVALRHAVEEIKPVKTGAAMRISWQRYFGEAAFPIWRGAFATIMIAVIAVSVFYVERRPANDDSIALAAAQVHQSIVSGKTPLFRAVNLAAMRKELAHAVGDRFQPVVLDLSLVKLFPIAGFVQNLGGRDLLVTVYQGDGPPITCFTFLGSETDAPKSAERFFDSDRGINYFSFSHDDLNGVLHREGDVICLLVSKMAPAELLSLLRGKTAHA
jgi:hypothetical protein